MDPFAVVPLMFVVVPVLMAAILLYAIIKGIAEWSYNNSQPVLTSPARVVAKRTNVSSHHHGTEGHNHTDTTYYATFELPTGERREIRLNGREYGQLTEGDEGEFTYQGTRYHGFVRRR